MLNHYGSDELSSVARVVLDSGGWQHFLHELMGIGKVCMVRNMFEAVRQRRCLKGNKIAHDRNCQVSVYHFGLESKLM